MEGFTHLVPFAAVHEAIRQGTGDLTLIRMTPDLIYDPGRYQDLTDDFSAQIAAFRKNEVEIVTGVVIPPAFTTFWNQANQKRSSRRRRRSARRCFSRCRWRR